MKEQKPKILFIMHMPPPVHGAAMVGKYIHDSKVINETFDCHYFNLTLAKNLEDIGKGGIRKFFDFIKQLRSIRKEVKRINPNLYYVTPNAKGGAFYKDFCVIMLLKLMGQHIVIHYHNKGVATRQNKIFDNFLYKHFFKGLKVILLAESLYDDVKKYVKKTDIFICHNGIPETLTKEPSVERNNKTPHLLFLSNLLISKGIIILLDACKILKERGYRFICDYVGGETKEMDAQQFKNEIKQRDLDGTVIYHGKKLGDEKVIFFKNADIFIFPTFYETFGLVNLEAMEYKLPIISTDEGGIKDIVKDGENGFIVKKKDPVSLAYCIERLLNDKDLRYKMGENGYKKYRSQFTLQTFENRMKEILAECCKLPDLKF